MTIRTSDLGGTNWADGDTLFSADLNDTYGAVTFHRKQFSDATERTINSSSWKDSGTQFTLTAPVGSIMTGFFLTIDISASQTTTVTSSVNIQLNGSNLGTQYFRLITNNNISTNSTEGALIIHTGNDSNTNFFPYNVSSFIPLKLLDASTTLKIRVIQSSASTDGKIKNVVLDVIYTEVFKED